MLMRNLYWKIFLCFWSAMLIVIFTVGWISLHFTQQNYLPLKQSALVASYAISAVITYEAGNKLALAQWFEALNKRSDIEAYLIDEHGKEVLDRRLDGQLEKIRQEFMHNQLPEDAFRDSNIIVSPLIQGSNGHQYRLLAEKHQPFSLFYYIKFTTFGVGFLIAIIISGLICYLLSRYLTRPLRLLTIAARRLAEGDLSIRIRNKLGARNDEIAELATEFDSMAEKLEQLIATQKRMLQDVSHELRSPLARLQVALELARKHTHDSPVKELNRIELEANRLNELIGQVLSFARVEVNEYKLNNSKFSLSELFHEIVGDLAYENNALAERIKLFVADECMVNADQKLLRSAFENLIRNALYYSPPETFVEVHVQCNTNVTNITIRDHGPGVPPEKLEQIFQPFYRVDDARSKGRGGYGLGLAIVKQAIELHGGKINAVNAVDGGLVINIDL